MSAVFNSPDRGESVEAKTSDAPQFDLRALFSEVRATTGGGANDNPETDQIDFGPSDIYRRSNDSHSGGSFNFEQQGAMQIARQFASFDDDRENPNNNMNFDREDAGRLVEVYGDIYNAQNAMQEGDQSEAKDWFAEMRRDLADFTRGLFSDSEEGAGAGGSGRGNEGCRGDESNLERGSDECSNEESSENHGFEEGSEQGSEHGSEEGSEHGSEEGSEHGTEHGAEESCEGGDTPVESGSEGFTPEDSMVLLMNDMQELAEALARGDTEAAQQILARMNRHLATLLRQLGQGGEEDQGQGEAQDPPGLGDWWRPRPIDSAEPIPGDRATIGLPTPSDMLRNLPQPPNPGDILRMLPQPPNPGDILRGLPQPPNPGDLLRGLPQPPNPQDVLRNIPKPPNPQDLLNPGNLLNNLPSPSDLFDIF